jgi:anti-sigma-K factor RskA
VKTKEYIESGILEAYALGSLPPDEMREVAANIAQYPELAKELEAIESAISEYSLLAVTQPPQGLEDKIWDAIEAGKPAAGSATATSSAPRVIPFQPEYRKPTQWKYAAALVVLAGSLALNAVLWNNSNKTNSDTTALVSRMDSLNKQQQQLAAVVDDYRKAKAMMSDTGMVTIVMHTMKKGHAMAATLYWSKDKAEGYVSVDGLPTPPAGMQYQLWAIKDGKPIDMGVLPNDMANTPAIQKVSKPMTGGEAFAISLEKMGGSPVPTMENIYVLGKA